jgi:hypothetical protein
MGIGVFSTAKNAGFDKIGFRNSASFSRKQSHIPMLIGSEISSDISQSDATLGYNQRYKNWG